MSEKIQVFIIEGPAGVVGRYIRAQDFHNAMVAMRDALEATHDIAIAAGGNPPPLPPREDILPCL